MFIKTYLLLYYPKIQQIQENQTSIMARKVDERLPEGFFIQLLTEKANIIKDHLRSRHSKLTLVANIVLLWPPLNYMF